MFYSLESKPSDLWRLLSTKNPAKIKTILFAAWQISPLGLLPGCKGVEYLEELFMLCLEKKDGVVQLTIKCVHKEAFQVVQTVFGCFGWGDPRGKTPDFIRAASIARQEEEMEEGEKLVLIKGISNE